MNPIRKSAFLITELGLKQLVPFAFYQFRLRSGILRSKTPIGGWKSDLALSPEAAIRFPFQINQHSLAGLDRQPIFTEADELLQGIYHPFGGHAALLTLKLPDSKLDHWTRYGSTFNGEDIKFSWEPARFSWAYALIEAAILSGDDRYAACFWQHFDQYYEANPVNSGPNWASAQEVALRLLTMLFAWQNLKAFPSSTRERSEKLLRLVEQSARRISSTLDYARSQNNNHVLSEALGLIAAGSFFTNCHPQAERWKTLGFREFEKGLLTQIEPNGTYSQHSTYYHRLMLQLALIYSAYAQQDNRKVNPLILDRVAAAVRWLLAQLDEPSGHVPNLGHNDGSLLLPFGSANYADFRPTLQAASYAFLNQPAFEPGDWDALPLILGLQVNRSNQIMVLAPGSSPAIHRVGNDRCWGSLRAVTYHSRPAHSDQLSVDLWWEGQNVAMDAGTCCYNSPPPWDNSLARTCVHNTISIDSQDQMLRAGRFLWLDRMNAAPHPTNDENSRAASVTWKTTPAIHHTRSLHFISGVGFTVRDALLTARRSDSILHADLQWLLPDWTYELLPAGIRLTRADGHVLLTFEASSQETEAPETKLSLIRAGVSLAGDLENPIRGWYSPTYAQKEPALSLVLRVTFRHNLQIISTWNLKSSTGKTG